MSYIESERSEDEMKHDESCMSACDVLLIKGPVVSWLERRPVTAKVEGSSPFWVVCNVISIYTIILWDLSSAGRASALQAEGHRFEPCRSHFLCRYGSIGRAADL